MPLKSLAANGRDGAGLRFRAFACSPTSACVDSIDLRKPRKAALQARDLAWFDANPAETVRSRRPELADVPPGLTITPDTRVLLIELPRRGIFALLAPRGADLPDCGPELAVAFRTILDQWPPAMLALKKAFRENAKQPAP